MHKSSYEHMEKLVNKYLLDIPKLNIIDIGSYNVIGSYKTLFTKNNWIYTGVDTAAGPNVDIVLEDPYKLPFPDNHTDVIVSGQAFEHIEFFWLTFQEMTRILKPMGYIFLLAPSRGREHKYPVDCWRFYPDGFRALAKYCSLEILEVHTDWTPHPDNLSAEWGDTVGVFWKS